jgi:hypothetical protein
MITIKVDDKLRRGHQVGSLKIVSEGHLEPLASSARLTRHSVDFTQTCPGTGHPGVLTVGAAVRYETCAAEA